MPKEWVVFYWYGGPGRPSCLKMLPMGFAKEVLKWAMTPVLSEKADARRRVVADGKKITLDDLGRFTIPEDLAVKAQIDKVVKFVAMLDHVELWDPGLYKWRSQLDEALRPEVMGTVELEWGGGSKTSAVGTLSPAHGVGNEPAQAS